MPTSTPASAPFPPSAALNRDLLSACPYSNCQNDSPRSDNEAGHIAYVPGDPVVSLVHDEVLVHVSNQLETPLLDKLHDKLWLVARKSGDSIDPLHRQKVKGRIIVPTEDPRLHLVWDRDKIYVKPVPVFLLNHDFWTTYLPPLPLGTSSDVAQRLSHSGPLTFDRSIATGFLRSYAFLVQHRLDFALAKEVHLIPDDVQNWLQWSKFINHFRHLPDESVAKRYHYGQLRLSRLNWTVRIFRPKHASTMWFYEIPHWSTTDFVKTAMVPLLFLFASVSLVLSSMQVVLSVPTDDPALGESTVQDMGRAFWGFSVAVILGWVVVWSLLLGIPLAVLAWQVLWGFTKEKERRAVSDA